MPHKYMLLYRTPAAAETKAPSAEEMTAVLTQWQAWKKAFPGILDLGDALLATGRSIKGKMVSDGPSVESKEIISGYSIIAAADYEAAVTIAKACPLLAMPDATIEIREMVGY